MRLTIRRVLAVASVLLLGALGCHRERRPQPAPVVRTPFEQALFFGDAYALANGAAYVGSHREGLFYVADGVAEKVIGLPPDAHGEITALADGSALFQPHLADPPKLYWLRGATAGVVSEGHIVGQTNAPVIPEGFLFAENQRLKRQLEETADELAAMQEPDEPDYEPEPH